MQINFEKAGGLIPAVLQDARTLKVLMVGFMNQEAYRLTVESGKATFFSRTKNRIWTKGETTGHFLLIQEILLDCDQDTLLIKALPLGPTCHTGNDTCFQEINSGAISFLSELTDVIANRHSNPTDTSYTASLFKKGINKIAQKVGEEAIELVIEAKDTNNELFLNEAADLLYHYMVLLQAKGTKLDEVVTLLQTRHKK